MKHRINMRTGKIEKGPRKKKEVLSTNTIKIMIAPEDTLIAGSIESSVIKALQQVKEEILTALNNLSISNITREQLEELALPQIEIDDSIVDVGIEEKEKLKKGLESATLTKADTEKDSSLRKAKNKLQKLKKK